jgi:hypothetical protein
MIRSLAILSLALMLLSCGGNENAVDPVQAHNDKETHEVSPPVPRLIQNKVVIDRHFSSQSSMDKFVLSIRGKTLEKADICFAILNFNHDTLFVRSTKGAVLLQQASQQYLTNEETKHEYINLRMSSFFSSKAFSNPPYTLNDPTKPEFPGNLEVWNEISSDSTSWCFEFSLLDGGGSEVIAFSKSKDSIIVYDVSP